MSFLFGDTLFLLYLIGMFIIVCIKKDNSFGNFVWGGGVLLCTIYSFLLSTFQARQILITALICCWGLRLGIYFYSRYKKGADPRFLAWQTTYGIWSFCITFGWVVILQGLHSFIMSLPSIVVNVTKTQPAINWLDIVGLLVWIIGFLCESIADYQLHNFMHNPENKNKVMKYGLWHYSRHPNYFGEICMWWGIFFIALSVNYGWFTIIAPITISVLLIFFTGIPIIEKTFKNNSEYEDYKQRTSMLIPWFVK